MSMKKPNDTIGNRTRDLPACSAVPQPTAPPHHNVEGDKNKEDEWAMWYMCGRQDMHTGVWWGNLLETI
jgi:hypothetical protein